MLFLDWLFLLFGVGLTLVCAKRGFILTLLKFFKVLLSTLVAHLLGGKIGAVIASLLEKYFHPCLRIALTKL